MPEVRIRPAVAAEYEQVRQIVIAAYSPYIDRIGQPPGPMTDDYAALIDAGHCHVATAPDICGLIVLIPQDGALLLDNIAVSPEWHGQGIGRILLDFAEAEARRTGRAKITLYTHVMMTENQQIYASRGYVETGRAIENGFDRVYMAKTLA